jgi:hypothetical protein
LRSECGEGLSGGLDAGDGDGLAIERAPSGLAHLGYLCSVRRLEAVRPALRLGDIDADGDLDLCARANAGVRCARWDGAAHTDRFDGPDWSDDAGWASLDRARSIRLASQP